MGLGGLNQINIELTARCDKHTLCGFCGHQNEKINPNTKGDMEFALLVEIMEQLPKGVVVQFHRDGEPTAYPTLGGALLVFSDFITSIVTHGENLIEKADQIVGQATSLTVSAFKGDPDQEIQYRNVREFLRLKGERPPVVNIKIVGDTTPEMEILYGSLGVPIIRRLLHIPSGNNKYFRRSPTIPEHGICVDFLSHPSIDWRGRLYVCNRLDARDEGLLGDLNESSFDALWNSEKRMAWLDAHKRGVRAEAAPLCRTCIFYGVPSGA